MKFWKVTTRYFDTGKVDVFVEQIQAEKMPNDVSSETAKYDEYIEHFKTRKEAERWAEDARNA